MDSTKGRQFCGPGPVRIAQAVGARESMWFALRGAVVATSSARAHRVRARNTAGIFWATISRGIEALVTPPPCWCRSWA